MSAVLALRGVRHGYGGGFVLDIPSLDILTGEVLAVIGPNGSGKSTLLRLLGLLERPAAGLVLRGGRAVDARDALAERRRMAMVFQEPLLADTTVAANVALGLGFRGVDGHEVDRRVGHWLERFGIAQLATRPARTLSGGEAQRVALARALVLEPEILLLDEPFANLDQPARTALIADLGAVLRHDRTTTVLVTHHRGEAQALADRVAVLIGGCLGQLDETARVFQAPASEEVARFVGAETIVVGRVVGREAGVTRVEVGSHTLETLTPAPAGALVRVAIRPEDVTVLPVRGATVPSAARNVVAGSIARISVTDTGVRVLIDCGFSLTAAITARSLTELGLAEGVAVAAAFEPGALHLIAGGGSLDTPSAPAL